jgi:hypothetical protein
MEVNGKWPEILGFQVFIKNEIALKFNNFLTNTYGISNSYFVVESNGKFIFCSLYVLFPTAAIMVPP